MTALGMTPTSLILPNKLEFCHWLYWEQNQTTLSTSESHFYHSKHHANAVSGYKVGATIISSSISLASQGCRKSVPQRLLPGVPVFTQVLARPIYLSRGVWLNLILSQIILNILKVKYAHIFLQCATPPRFWMWIWWLSACFLSVCLQPALHLNPCSCV